MTNWNAELSDACRRLAGVAWDEDVRDGIDCTSWSLIDPRVEGQATVVSRKDGIVCGITAAAIIVDTLAPDLGFEPCLDDGDHVSAGSQLARIGGRARDILATERICLNLLGRLSGISTLTAQYVAAIKGTGAQVYDTRKTTPGLRLLEKYAVACGGGQNHRMGLFDAVLIKDNHLALSRDVNQDAPDTVERAVRMSREWIRQNTDRLPHGTHTIVQIEVDTLDQLSRALTEQPDIILLDNMDAATLTRAVAIRDQLAAGVQLEASGGVMLDTIRGIAKTGVSRISVGALTHSAVNFDIGLDWLDGP